MIALIIVIGFMIMAGVFLILQISILKKLFGIIIFSSGLNLIIFICGRLNSLNPTLLHNTAIKNHANPLPQALTLTAIVIGFALTTYLCALLKITINKNMDQ